jgi:hypothetical protein
MAHAGDVRLRDAAGGTRTHKRLRAMDFESIAFASLATAAAGLIEPN